MPYSIAERISKILRSDSPIVKSWSPSNIRISKEGLEFAVNGHFFKGRVRVISDSKLEYFDIIFFESDGTFHEAIFGFLAEELIEKIDNKVSLGNY